jgi:CubicO group peptidase (beta-lactamase class C family)
MVGIATEKYGLDIERAGALEEWRRPGDPRGRITVEHLLHMSSGLYGEGGGSPQSDIYYQGDTVEGRAVTNHLDSLPGTRFLYNPPDTMLLMRAVRQAVRDDAKFLVYPFEELFFKIGMTRTVTSSDWNGDFLMSGQTYSTARDFARFGLFYLADGVWNGERILPEGWAKYVATPSPAQPAGDGPRYGAQFWLYGGQAGLPADAYSPNGGQGQYAMIVPSRHVVVVRRGIDEGSGFKIAQFAADVLGALTP